MSDTYEKPKRRIWLRVVFAASLALNLMVIGLATGAMLRHGGMRDGPDGRHPAPSLGAVMYRALPREERHALRAATVERGSEDKPAGAKGSQVARMAAALRAPVFDAAAVASLLSEESLRREAWAETVEANLMTVITGMSAPERETYADRMEEVAQKRGKKGKWGDTPGK
ncbi:MAG: periplasmic heavy metal sensor [Pseudomonadota bacterium]|nr:periplasmic heavy metal sensor [Pseudomonadota bacterium]